MTTAGRMELFRLELEALAARALAAGVVLTLEVAPQRPLAMGNYALRAEARVCNAVYRGRALSPDDRRWRCATCGHHFCVCVGDEGRCPTCYLFNCVCGGEGR